MKRERIMSAAMQRTIVRALELAIVKNFSVNFSRHGETGIKCDIFDTDGEVFSAAGENIGDVIDTAVTAAEAGRDRKKYIPDWIKT